MDENTPATPDVDNGLPTDADNASLPQETAAAQPSPEPVEQTGQQETQPAEETPPAAPTVTDPLVDATMIMGQNSDLINQIQTMLPQEQVQQQSQIHANPAEPQLGAENQQSVFQFQEDIVNNVLEDPGNFADHIAQVVSQHIAEQAPMMIQQTLSAQNAEQAQYQQQADNFYTQNPELSEHREVVQAVAEGLVQKFPAITPTQLLAYTAQMVKGHLQSSQPEVTEQQLPNQVVTPLNTAGNTGNVGAQQLTEEQADFDTMLNFANKNSISF